MDIILIESLAKVIALCIDDILHLRHAKPFAHRAALMRAMISIRVTYTLVAYDPHFQVFDFGDDDVPVFDVIAATD